MALPVFFGLDFGNHSIKVVQVKDADRSPKLVSYGSASTPRGVIRSENVEHQKDLAKAAKELVNSLGIKTNKTVVALPESAIFTRLVTLPQMKNEEIESSVYWEAKQYIPVDISEVQLDWVEVGEMKVGDITQKRILIVAAPRTLVELYVKIVEIAGFEPIALETEAIANVRAMSNSSKNAKAIILDFGANSTDLAVMSEGNLLFSQSLSTGSDALTKAVMQEYAFSKEQAEEYKRTYGIDETQLEGRLANTLKPVTNLIVEEAKRAISFYRTHSAEEAPTQVFLVGDGARLPGLSTYMSRELGIGASVGNPWNNISLGERFGKELATGAPGYSVPVGLALKTN